MKDPKNDTEEYIEITFIFAFLVDPATSFLK